ncbi:MAG: hypothetical protein IH600_07290 [Bacteroidetes bacterium]|nr:hypothetical protein [Bacteroidota bacterium]
MQLFDDTVRVEYIRRVLWDVHTDVEAVLRALDGRAPAPGTLDLVTVYAKLLKSYSWHTLLRLIPADRLKEALDDDVLRRLWPASLRTRYEYARELLSRQSVSTSG